MNCDFTFKHYNAILTIAKNVGYRFGNFKESRQGPVLILRHDVDFSPRNALRFGTLEAEKGVRSTYFFLLRTPFYNLLEYNVVSVLRQLRKLGHEIGLHFDQQAVRVVDRRVLEAEVLYELSVVSRILGEEVKVVSFHNPLNNVFCWNAASFTNAYAASFFLKEMKYLSDSNHQWREGCLCRLLKERKYDRIQVLIHPELWDTRPGNVVERLTKAVNDSRLACQGYLEERNDVFKKRK